MVEPHSPGSKGIDAGQECIGKRLESVGHRFAEGLAIEHQLPDAPHRRFDALRLCTDVVGLLKAVVEPIIEVVQFAQLDVGQFEHRQNVLHIRAEDQRRVPGDDRQVVVVVGDAPDSSSRRC